MRNVLSILVASIFVLSLGALALAGGEHCTKSAATASTAGAAGCTASAVKTAGAAGCTASAMKTAGAGCSTAMGDHAVAIETVRMPSGALAIFYNGKNAETVAKLQAGAKENGAKFGCGLAADVAANENCSVEVANTERGILMLVTSSKSEVLDQVAAQYEVASAAHAEAPAGGGK